MTADMYLAATEAKASVTAVCKALGVPRSSDDARRTRDAQSATTSRREGRRQRAPQGQRLGRRRRRSHARHDRGRALSTTTFPRTSSRFGVLCSPSARAPTIASACTPRSGTKPQTKFIDKPRRGGHALRKQPVPPGSGAVTGRALRWGSTPRRRARCPPAAARGRPGRHRRGCASCPSSRRAHRPGRGRRWRGRRWAWWSRAPRRPRGP